MKIYVAAASSEMERAEKWMAALRSAGIEVVSTWPEVIRKVGSANPMGASREDRAMWASTDLAEVSSADVFWLLLGKPTSGAWVELGYAVMLGAVAKQARLAEIEGVPDLWLICSGTETSIFSALAHHYATDEEAFRALTLRFALVGTKTKGPEVALGAQIDRSEGG
jgi:hypothetical protein